MRSVASYCLLSQKKDNIVLHASIYRRDNSDIIEELFAATAKFQRTETFQIQRITRDDLNRMQPNEIARSSIYSRGVLAVAGKAKFFRLRFELRRAYNGSCF